MLSGAWWWVFCLRDSQIATLSNDGVEIDQGRFFCQSALRREPHVAYLRQQFLSPKTGTTHCDEAEGAGGMNLSHEHP